MICSTWFRLGWELYHFELKYTICKTYCPMTKLNCWAILWIYLFVHASPERSTLGKKLIWFQCTAIISKILPQVGAVKLCLLSYVSRSWCKIAVTLFGLRNFSGFLVLIRVASWRPPSVLVYGIHPSIIQPNQCNHQTSSQFRCYAYDNSLIL